MIRGSVSFPRLNIQILVTNNCDKPHATIVLTSGCLLKLLNISNTFLLLNRNPDILSLV